MKKQKFDWIIGINPVLRTVDILKNNPNNPFQADHLKSPELIIQVVKVPKHIRDRYQFVLETLYGLS